jgi:hypothetical protein
MTEWFTFIACAEIQPMERFAQRSTLSDSGKFGKKYITEKVMDIQTKQLAKGHVMPNSKLSAPAPHEFTPKESRSDICAGCGGLRITPAHGYDLERAALSAPAASPELRELLCQKCGRDYPVWFAPNELWNKVVRDGEHFLCMDCFALLAESRGVSTEAWMLSEGNLELSQVLEENRRLKLGLPLGHVTDQFAAASPSSVTPPQTSLEKFESLSAACVEAISTIGFLRSCVMCGESLTEEDKAKVNATLDKLSAIRAASKWIALEVEQLAESLHVWYLEATRELKPESFNPNTQKAYADLTEEQKFIDRFIAGKILARASSPSSATPLENLSSALHGMEGVSLNFRAQAIIRDLTNIVDA